MVDAGEGKGLENFVLQPLLCQEGPKKMGPCHEQVAERVDAS